MSKKKLVVELTHGGKKLVSAKQSRDGVVFHGDRLGKHMTMLPESDGSLSAHETTEGPEPTWKRLFVIRPAQLLAEPERWKAVEEKFRWLVRHRIENEQEFQGVGVKYLCTLTIEADPEANPMVLDSSLVHPDLILVAKAWQVPPGSTFLALNQRGKMVGLVMISDDGGVYFLPNREMGEALKVFMQAVSDPAYPFPADDFIDVFND